MGAMPGKRNDHTPTGAREALRMTPEERLLYQHHLANLSGPGGVDNSDGSRSTLKAMTVGVNDKTYLIPSVWGGKIVSEDDAVTQADKVGWSKFPSYATPEEADARYDVIHKLMEGDGGAAISRAKIRMMSRPVIVGGG